LTIQLANIATDPDSPNTKKKLLFTVSGEEITSGDSLTIEVGGNSGQYDKVVPNSAIYSDSDGDFVLMLTQKKTPLGTRYVATRVDVSVTTKDDSNSAITGGVATWDYVVSGSSAPVTAGQYVRLATS